MITLGWAGLLALSAPAGARTLSFQPYLLPVGAVLGSLLLIVLGLKRHRRQQSQWRREQRLKLLISLGGESSGVGAVIGGYVLTKELGSGGMGTVYQGILSQDLNESKAVAIKVLNSGLTSNEEYRRRFLREIAVLDSLDHPNIVKILASGQDTLGCYLVMEQLQGQTLRELLLARRFGWLEAVELLSPVVDAVEFALQQGIVHRDLKPENLFVTREGHIKVMDFGLARAESGMDAITGTGDSALGTPSYIAPECIQGIRFSPAGDQYALGVILYELVTGRCPFDGTDPLQVIMQHLTGPVPHARESVADIPVALDDLICRPLAKDPQQRFPSCLALGQALSQIRQQVLTGSQEGTASLGPYSGLKGLRPQSFSAYRGASRVCLKRADTYLPAGDWLQAQRGSLEAWRSFDHPGLRNWSEWQVLEGGAYVSRDWLEGTPLTPQPLEASRLLEPLLQLLASIHGRSLCHLNLKPANLFWTNKGLIVTDPWVDGLVQADSAYQAPEQKVGAGYAAADQFAAGALFYYVLTGRPFVGDVAQISAAELGPWRDPLVRMLRSQPGQRYPSVSQALLSIQQCLQGSSTQQQSTQELPRRQ